MDIKPCAAGNYRPGRPPHLQVEAVVIHSTNGPLADTEAAFAKADAAGPRSAHYGISAAGDVHRYVEESDTAFHAGIIVGSTWTGLKRGIGGAFINPNFYTIGIEHEGTDDSPWPDALYDASAALLRDLSARHPGLRILSRRNVVLHREIRIDRSCPGPLVDIDRLIFAATGGASTDATLKEPRQLRTRASLNVRRGSPSTRAPVVRVIDPDHVVNVIREVTGEQVNGVSRWYQNLDGDFLWSGALEDSTTP
jgi:N-acetyl-anhydromuramyl-L-alanine amidase AmpD